jgi:hypothetical protein
MTDLRKRKFARHNANLMRQMPGRILTALSVLCAVFVSEFARSAPLESPVTIQIDTNNPGPFISTNFSGVSFEAALLRPENGMHYFRADNQPLINLFHTLGIKSLRIGGNTSDRDARQLPSEADLDSLFAFARAAGVKVLYCLRLHDGDTNVDIQTAKYIMGHYARLMDCFSIGQEPSAYPVENRDTRPNTERMGATNEKYSYASYREDWKQFADALIAAVPEIKFCGPSVHNNGEWARRFMEDFGQSNQVVLITEHLYAGGAGGKVPTPEIGRDRMLANDAWGTNGFPKAYKKLYDSFAPMALSNGLPYRLEEVNNYFNGGAKNVSDTFAASLWGLDFMYWWAEHQAAGLNFHTGDRVAAGYTLQPSKYTAFFSTTNGYIVRPLGYGIKAFDLGSHGRFVPAAVSASSNLNLSTYTVLGHDKNLYVTLINKEHGENGRAATVTLAAGTNFTQGEIISLTQSDGDAAATSGITLGGAEIQRDGNWAGTWKTIYADDAGAFSVTVPAASAMIVRLMPPIPNYDERKVGSYTLPDPLVLLNGKTVADAKTWMKKRRPEILKLYHDDIYGRNPAHVPAMRFTTQEVDRHALGNKAVRKQVDIWFPGHSQPALHVLLYTPADAKGPVPTFLCLSFTANCKTVRDPFILINKIWDNKRDVSYMTNDCGETSHSWKIPETLARGYGIAVVNYEDIEPDLADGSGWRFGVRSLFLKPGRTNTAPDSWGAIGAWAWGASRVMDYLQTDKDVDGKHVIMLGHSRLGKTALWAGAQDQRFCMVIASCSGEMGAALARRNYGETVTTMAKSFPYQFCRNFLSYSNRISEMPVDSHMLISLIAPRPLYLSTGSEDRWGDPKGEFLAAKAATPVYRLFDLRGLDNYEFPPLDQAILRDIGFSCHTGKHDVIPEDWDRFLDFADLHLKKAG